MKIAIVVAHLRQFKQRDFLQLNNELRSKKILADRYLYNLQLCADKGLNYIGIDKICGLYS